MRIVKVTWVDAEEYGEVGWNSIKSMQSYAKNHALLWLRWGMSCMKAMTISHLLEPWDPRKAVV